MWSSQPLVKVGVMTMIPEGDCKDGGPHEDHSVWGGGWGCRDGGPHRRPQCVWGFGFSEPVLSLGVRSGEEVILVPTSIRPVVAHEHRGVVNTSFVPYPRLLTTPPPPIEAS